MAKVIFFGTPDYVIPVLDALKSTGHEVTAVVTQPPKPVGRKQKVTHSPVSLWAKKYGIPVLTDLTPLCKGVTQGEVGILASYGRILPIETLKVFPHGIVNVHPSLLPKYRGAAPVAAAIASGDQQTGVTIMKLDEELDHGPILSQFTEDIKPTNTRGSLRERLFKQGAEVLTTTLPAYLEGKIKLREQDHSKASYTTLIKKDHGFIPPKYINLASQVFDPEAQTRRGETLRTQWQIPFIKDYSLMPSAFAIERFIRALDPWPGTWTTVQVNSKSEIRNSKRLKILKAHLEDGKLILDQVQLEGKKPVTFKQLLEGYPALAFPS